MIPIQCSCGYEMRARDEHAGKAVLCPQCQQRVQIPALHDHVQPEPPAAPGPPPLDPRDEFERPGRRRPRRSFDEEYERPRSQLRRETSTKALVGFMLGLATFVVPVIMAVPAILFSILGLKEIKSHGGRMTGRGLAKAGLILGILGNVTLVGYIWGFRVVREQAVREEATLVSRNNLKQIALAFHNYHDVYKRMPPAVVFDKAGKPLYGWRVLILPFVEQRNLYRQFRLDEPWDSPHNKQFLNQMPPVYHISGKQEMDATKTYYQVFTGQDTVFGPKQPMNKFFLRAELGLKSSRGIRLFEMPDGTSNTILVAEGAKPVPWTAPDDIPFDSARPFSGIGGVFENGCNVALGDGSVRFISFDRVSPETMRRAVNPQDGQPLGADW